MKKFNRKELLGSIVGTTAWAILAFPVGVMAAKAAACKTEVGGFLGLPTWYKYLSPTFSGDECQLNFNVATDLPKVLLAIFEIILRIGGLVAVGMIIYGGIQYMLSQGEPDKAKGARSTILNAIIGLVLTMSAVAIVNLIGKNL